MPVHVIYIATLFTELNSIVSCPVFVSAKRSLINSFDNFFEEKPWEVPRVTDLPLIADRKQLEKEATNWWFIHNVLLLHLSLKIYDEGKLAAKDEAIVASGRHGVKSTLESNGEKIKFSDG